LIDFAIADRPTERGRYASKWAAIVAAVLATAESGQAVRVDRATVQADNRRIYNSILASVKRRAARGMGMKSQSVGEHYYLWLEARTDAPTRAVAPHTASQAGLLVKARSQEPASIPGARLAPGRSLSREN
jgi:hypothetical protein